MNHVGAYHEQEWMGIALPFLWPVLLGLIWICTILLANPIGDFPLNDDWAYAYSVQHLLQHGELRFSDWTATNLLGQVVWGALFCLPFGFSFTALRFSTVVLGFVGILGTYGILRELNTSRQIAAIGALTLAFCPIYFALSLTFMNDVPFVAFAIASLYFFMRGLRLESAPAIAASFILAGLAILTRQTGLALPIAFACALLTKKGIQPSSLWLSFLIVAIGIGLQFAYQAWLSHAGLLPANFNRQISTILANSRMHLRPMLRDAVSISFFFVMYLGFFTAPVLPFVSSSFGAKGKFSRTTSAMVTAAVLVLFGAILIWIGKLMPFWRNILDEAGVGTAGAGSVSKRPGAPVAFWVAGTAMAFAGSVALVRNGLSALAILYNDLRSHSARCHSWQLLLLLSLAIVCFVPLPLAGFDQFGAYDRYILIFITLAIGICASVPRKETATFLSIIFRGAALVLLAIYALFSVAATHDYLAWNRVRWNALQELTREAKVPFDRIQGGFEFYGWYRFDKNSVMEWWREKHYDYIVSFDHQEGYQVIKQYAVPWWLPWQRRAGDIFVEEANPGSG